MTREEAIRRTNEYPVTMRHGRVYLSSALIAALVGAVMSIAFAKFQAEDHEKRLKHLEDTSANSEDVKYVRGRIDYAIDQIIRLQELVRK